MYDGFRQASDMKFFLTICFSLALLLFCGCGDKEASLEEQLQGRWIQSDESRYIQIQLDPEGMWSSHVKIANPRSRIIDSKGDASGTWYVQEKQLTMTAAESDIEKVWKKNTIYSFDIQEVLANAILLINGKGKTLQWEKETPGKNPEQDSASVLSMAPIAVNLDKISSNTKDSYLCVKMKIALKELMPGVPVPVMHPRIREAAVLFFSSLIHDQVRTFDLIELQKKALVKVLNPYLDGAIKEIDLEKILITSSHEKVEEFLMEFAPPLPPEESAQEE